MHHLYGFWWIITGIMKSPLILFMVFAVINAKQLNTVDACIKSIQDNVHGKTTTKALSGLVGIGWDDLLNTPTLPILATEFKNCKSDASNSYLLPDNVVDVPIETSNVEKSSTQIDTFKEYMERSSNKLGVAASATVKGVEVGGSFGSENSKSKEGFDKQQSIMLLNKIQYSAFELIADENGGLDEYFLERLDEIAFAVSENRMLWGKFLAEVFISDFGTHLINKATAGAEISQETYITKSETYKGERTMDAYKAEISLGFKAIAKITIGYESKKETSEKHTTSNITTTSILRARGGPNIDRLSGAKLNESMFYVENLIGMKQSGKFIYQIISAVPFPKYNDFVKYTVRELLENATQDYYTFNFRPGCMDVESENYNPIANTDDGSCQDPNLLFANEGIFQTCSFVSAVTEDGETIPWTNLCENYEKRNGNTNTFGCENAKPKQIGSVIMESSERKLKMNVKKCGMLSSIFGCKIERVEMTMIEKIRLDSFWCPIIVELDETELERPINELDKILNHKVLQKLNSEPELLHMYFDQYENPWEKLPAVCKLNVDDIFVQKDKGQLQVQVVADIYDTMARGFAESGSNANRQYPVKCYDYESILRKLRSPTRWIFKSSGPTNLLKIRPDQFEKLQYYPKVLQHLLPILDIPWNVIATNSFHERLSNAPKLLKQLIFRNMPVIHDKEPEQVIRFGGAFKSGTLNPFTGTYDCPPNFIPTKILSDFNLCLSTDRKLKWPLRLGGFYNCTSDLKLCPRGYSAYLGTVSNKCEFHYCIRYHSRHNYMPVVINKPPYTDYETANLESIPIN